MEVNGKTMSDDQFAAYLSLEHKDPLSCFATNVMQAGKPPFFAPSRFQAYREHIIGVKKASGIVPTTYKEEL